MSDEPWKSAPIVEQEKDQPWKAAPIVSAEEPPKVGTGRSLVNLGLKGAGVQGPYMGIEGTARLYAEKTRAEKNFYDKLADKIGGTIGEKWKDLNKGFASLDPANWYADAVSDTRESIDAATPVDQSVAESIPGQVVQGLGQAVTTLPTYAIPGLGPTLTVSQLYQEGRDDYERTQEAQGKPVDPAKAHEAGLKNAPAAAFEVLGDKLVIGKVLQPLKGKMKLKDLGLGAGVTFASGGATEGAQTFWTNVNAKYLTGYDPDRWLDDEVINSIIVGGLVDSTIATTGSGATMALERLSNPRVDQGPDADALDAINQSLTEAATPDSPRMVPVAQAREEIRQKRIDEEADPERKRLLKQSAALESEIEALRQKGGENYDALTEQEYNRLRMARTMLEDIRSELAPAQPAVNNEQAATRIPTDEELARAMQEQLSPEGQERLRTQIKQAAEDRNDQEISEYLKAPQGERQQRLVRRRGLLRQLGNTPVYKWTDDQVAELAQLGNVKARREQVRRDKDDYAKRMEKSVAAERQRRLSQQPYDQLKREDLEFLADREDEAAMDRLIQVDRQEEYESQFDPKEELLEAIKAIGGLPHPAELRKQGKREPLIAELENLYESTAQVRKLKNRKGQFYEKKVPPNGLWSRKKLNGLDQLRERLQADYGFSWFLTPDDLLNAIDERVREGRKIYPDYAMNYADDARDSVNFSRRREGSIEPRWTGYENNLPAAIQKLKDEQRGVAVGVLTHPEVNGRIDLPWGEYDPKSDGYGLKKILEKNPNHARTAEDLQAFLNSLEVYQRGPNRIRLRSKDGKAVVRLDWNGRRSSPWLLTAFYEQESPAGDTGVQPGLNSSPPDEAISEQQDRSEINKSQINLSRSPGRNSNQDRAKQTRIEATLAPIRESWKGRARVEVVATAADLPPLYRRMIEAEGPGAIEGFYDKRTRTSWLIAENIANEQQAQSVLFHEVVGHHGMREILGEQFEPFMQSVWQRAKDTPAMQDIVEDYMLDPTDATDQLEAAQEYVAELAEGGVQDPPLWRRIVAAVREWLRNSGFTIDVSDADIRAALARANRQLEQPRKEGPQREPGRQTEPSVAMSRQNEKPVTFSRKRYTADLDQLRQREAEYTAQIEQAKASGQPPSSTMLGTRAEIRAQIGDLMNQAERSVEGLDREGNPVASEAEPVNNAHSDVETSTHAPEGSLTMWWKQLKIVLTGFKDAIPELPKYGNWQGKVPQFFVKFREGHRLLIASTDVVRKQAQEDLAHVIQPIRDLGREEIDANTMARLKKQVKRRKKLRKMGEPVPESIEKEIAFIEQKLGSNPFYLFQNAVLYRDLWYRSLMHNKDGKPLQLPGGLDAEAVRKRLGNLHSLIARHEHAAAINESLKRHYALVEGLQKDLLDHGQMIPEDLRNPLYFPHHVIEHFSGKLGRVQALPEEPFRNYLIEPVGSTKAIEADYLKAVYHHVVQVRAHNRQQDIVEQYWQPYDISAKVQTELEVAAAAEGRRVEAGAWNNENNWPAGYTRYTVDDALPLRREYVIDREKLSEQLGIVLGDGDLRARMREKGVKATLTPEMLQTAFAAGEEKQWLVPEPVAEALRNIKERQKISSSRWFKIGSGIIGMPMRIWKYNILFAPWNYLRYEFNNTIGDLEKVAVMDPAVFKELLPAAKELRAFYKGGKASLELREAFKRGVIDSVTVQESGQLKEFDDFIEFMTSTELTLRNLKKWATKTTEFARMREGMFRYAKFKLDVGRIENGAEPIYGGAYIPDVKAREGKYAQAAYISLRTFGDYANISLTGQAVRQQIQPFFSWMEINFRYHANLARNTAYLYQLGRAQAATENAKLQGKQAALQSLTGSVRVGMAAADIWIKLGLIQVAVAMWNNVIGQMLSPFEWPEDEDLESQLSEHDRRRFHIILGKDSNGKVMVVHTPTAFSDIMEWFGGNKLSNLVTDYFKGDITFEMMVKDYSKDLPSDLINKVVQGVRPDVKGVYMAASRKDPFPDIFNQRTISEHDLWWNVLSTTTDRSAALALRNLLDDEYYSPQSFPEWFQQVALQVRRRDPEQWAYYEIREKTAEWLEEKTGVTKGGFDYTSPDQQAIRNFRKAIYNQDIGAAIRFYNILMAYGYTSERFRSSIRAQHPLSGLSKAAQAEWLSTLTEHEQTQLRAALAFYQRMAANQGREEYLFPKSGREQYFQPNYTELIRLMNQSMFTTDAEKMRFAEELLGRSLR